MRPHLKEDALPYHALRRGLQFPIGPILQSLWTLTSPSGRHHSVYRQKKFTQRYRPCDCLQMNLRIIAPFPNITPPASMQ